MKSTLAYQLLATFSKQDIREARKWLASPYHNQREDLRQLYEQIIASMEASEVISHEEAWGQLFPGESYDGQRLRLLLSYLFRSLEAFLKQREWESQAWRYEHLLLAAYRRRGLEGHFQKAYRRLNKRQKSHKERPAEHHFAAYALEQEHYRMESAVGRTRELNLQELEQELTYAFLAMKLRQGCFVLSHQAVYNTNYEVALEKELLALASRPPYIEQPAIAVYFHGYRALRFPEQEALFTLFRKQLMESLGRFPREELRDLFLLGINLCIRKINRNQSAFLREALELYRRGIEEALLIEEGRLSRFTYNNVIGIALRLNELNWAEQFLHRYRPLLEAEQREATFSLNAARLAYARSDYGAALAHLQRADYKDLINNMVAKTLQLRAYYELEEYSLLESHLKTMQTFLRRQRRMGYHQQNYDNILRFTRRLLSLRPGDRKARQALYTAIQKAEPLTEKQWLLEKLEEG